VFASLFLTFFLLAGANYSSGVRTAAGYMGLLCGGSAIYTGFAILFQVWVWVKATVLHRLILLLRIGALLPHT
jgi:succinate-acetate transporter protein